MMTLQERVHKAKPREQWRLNKLHHVLNVRGNNKNKGMINDNLLSLSYGRIVNKNIDTAEGLLPESFETYQIVQPGDIVMRLTDLQNDKRSIRQGLVKEQGIITSAYDAVYPKKGHDSRFWAYALLALDLAKYYYSLGGGVRQSIKFKGFPNDWIFTPPAEVQKEIADFLDRETARIDLLIEKKAKFLKLSKERIDSLLFSSISELNVPEAKLGHFVSKIGSGKTPRGGAEIYQEHGVSFLRSQNIYNDGIRCEDIAYISNEIDEEMSATRVKENDVLLNITGGSIGRCAGAKKEILPANVNQHVCIIRPNAKILPEFLHLLLISNKIQSQIKLESFSANREGLNFQEIRNLRVQIPNNKHQQEALVLAFYRLNDKIQKITELTKESIDKLKEFRTSLITEAVTGQLDIKAWKKKRGTDKRLDNIEEAMAS